MIISSFSYVLINTTNEPPACISTVVPWSISTIQKVRNHSMTHGWSKLENRNFIKFRMFKQELIASKSVSSPTTGPSSWKMRKSCSYKHLETRFLTMIFFVNKLTTCRFKFSFKNTHTVFRHFILYSMAHSINKIGEILWYEISL